MKKVPQLFLVAVGMMLASAPAFASTCNGITQQVAGMVQYEVAHTAYHAEMLWFALTTDDYRLLMQLTTCSTRGVMSTLLFNPAGWAAQAAMFYAVPAGRNWWKQGPRKMSMFRLDRS